MTVPVNLGALLSELTRAHASRVDLSTPSAAILVKASADRLTQAFGNIVDNAISFSPAEGRVSIALCEEEGHAIVRVDDEGPGIPPEHLDRIFDRFFSFRPTAAEDRSQHDGLGLAIARAVVDGYGGSISAMSLPAGGARIEVRLPIA